MIAAAVVKCLRGDCILRYSTDIFYLIWYICTLEPLSSNITYEIKTLLGSWGYCNFFIIIIIIIIIIIRSSSSSNSSSSSSPNEQIQSNESAFLSFFSFFLSFFLICSVQYFQLEAPSIIQFCSKC